MIFFKSRLGRMLLALISVTLWGSAFAGAKIGFEYMPPIMLSGLRFTLAGLLLVPVGFVMKIKWRELLANWRFIVFFGMIQTVLQYGLFYTGLSYTPGSLAAIIIGAGPLFIAVMSHFTLSDDKLTWRNISAFLIGVMGVVFISINPEESVAALNPHFYLGVALLILSNLVGSYTNIMVVKYKGVLSSVGLTMGANFTGGIILFLISLFVEGTSSLEQSLPLEFYFALLWLAIIPAAAFSMWYYLLSLPDTKVSQLNIWKFLIPIVGVLMSWWLLPEDSPSWRAIVGIVVITLSVLMHKRTK